MIRLNSKLGFVLLTAALIIALSAFAPTPASTPVAEAGCGAHYGDWYTQSTWTTCTWDFGCWINPWTPDNVSQFWTRRCRAKYDDAWRYCGTDCSDAANNQGCC
jgi:hypothetical protein